MDEMAPAVALPLATISAPLVESPTEIARFKLVPDAAAAPLPVEEESKRSGDPPAAAPEPPLVEAEARGGRAGGSVYLTDYSPLWGSTSICGLRPEMEDAVAAVPRFFDLPMRMVAGDRVTDGLDPSSVRLPAHFFGVYDGHGGAQVADYCRDRVHSALVEELQRPPREDDGGGGGGGEQQRWERAFTDCFQQVDDEVGGKARRGISGEGGADALSDPVAPETVGSTAVAAVVCSSHIIVANCGDSRAVLCRGKQPVALSVDHKPNREDEYARIEAEGGKVIQWNGYRVLGVLAMSRSIEISATSQSIWVQKSN